MGALRSASSAQLWTVLLCVVVGIIVAGVVLVAMLWGRRMGDEDEAPLDPSQRQNLKERLLELSGSTSTAPRKSA